MAAAALRVQYFFPHNINIVLGAVVFNCAGGFQVEMKETKVNGEGRSFTAFVKKGALAGQQGPAPMVKGHGGAAEHTHAPAW